MPDTLNLSASQRRALDEIDRTGHVWSRVGRLAHDGTTWYPAQSTLDALAALGLIVETSNHGIPGRRYERAR